MSTSNLHIHVCTCVFTGTQRYNPGLSDRESKFSSTMGQKNESALDIAVKLGVIEAKREDIVEQRSSGCPQASVRNSLMDLNRQDQAQASRG